MISRAIIFLLLIISLVNAEKITFTDSVSHEIDGKNITLIKFDSLVNRALFCVNGITRILVEDEEKVINDVIIDALEVRSDRVIADIDYKCKGCKCDEQCDNSLCFKEELVEQATEIEEKIEQQQKNNWIVAPEDAPEEVIRETSIPTIWKITASLIIIILLLGIFFLWRKI